MARVAIVGVGAIGGALAGLLETTDGHEITLCTRRPMPQLTVRTPEGVVNVTARYITETANAPAVDWVLVATKTYDAEGASRWFPALCAEGASVAIVQNGVEHRERFAAYVSEKRLLPVIIDCPVERTADGSVWVRGRARMLIENTTLGQDFAALFAGSTASLELMDDFKSAAWWKLCVNSPGALSALALKAAGVFRRENVGPLTLEMVAECAAVGRAEGARLSEKIGEEVLEGYRKHPVDSVNSLLADRRAGRHMEWDARNGVIVRLGQKHGIDTPLNRMAAVLLEAAETDIP